MDKIKKIVLLSLMIIFLFFIIYFVRIMLYKNSFSNFQNRWTVELMTNLSDMYIIKRVIKKNNEFDKYYLYNKDYNLIYKTVGNWNLSEINFDVVNNKNLKVNVKYYSNKFVFNDGVNNFFIVLDKKENSCGQINMNDGEDIFDCVVSNKNGIENYLIKMEDIEVIKINKVDENQSEIFGDKLDKKDMEKGDIGNDIEYYGLNIIKKDIKKYLIIFFILFVIKSQNEKDISYD